MAYPHRLNYCQCFVTFKTLLSRKGQATNFVLKNKIIFYYEFINKNARSIYLRKKLSKILKFTDVAGLILIIITS